ncbi:MAG: hypothetical protein QNJ38_22780 [Prochloraceae cyanobacterium]|nr:hypothetical protein [Prochloraceae cyanobacterium]
MIQAKFSLESTQIEFLNEFKNYGFKDKSEMVRAAILKLKQELELKTLIDSAEIYTELYSNDEELQELTGSAIE